MAATGWNATPPQAYLPARRLSISATADRAYSVLDVATNVDK